MIKGNIIAIGGDPKEENNPFFELYLLSQVKNKENPKICLIPTASGDSYGYINYFIKHYSQFYCEPTYLSLFSPPTNDLKSFLMEQDIIYVGGGNTKNMLAIWDAWNLVPALRYACERGVILSGLSAGAVCWFEQCITDSNPGKMSVMKCAGFIEGSYSPHYNSQKTRRPAYHNYLKNNLIKNGFACEDGTAIHFEDGKLKAVITASLGGQVFKLENKDSVVTEDLLKTEYLAGNEDINAYIDSRYTKNPS